MSSPQPATPIDETTQQRINKDDESDNEEDISSQPSGFVRIANIEEFEKLDLLVSNIQNAFISTTTTTTTTSNGITDGSSNINNGGVSAAPAPTGNNNNANKKKEETMLQKDVKHIQKNVIYIKENVDDLKTSPYSDRAEEQLQYLMDAALNQSADDFIEHPDNLKHLLQIVAKLKHWVPPQRPVDPEGSENAKKKNNSDEKKKKKESPIVSKKDKENAAAEIVKTLVSYNCEEWGMDGLLKSYGELEVRDKLCLLCFSVFPCDVDMVVKRDRNKEKDEKAVFVVEKNLVIKKKILIYWWVGEGFIVLPPPKVNADSDPSQNLGPKPNPSPDLNSITVTDPQEIPAPHPNIDSAPNPSLDQDQSVEHKGKTIEQIGEQILNVLRDKGFIEPVMRRGRESGSYQMHPFVHSFVTALAKRAGFFDFSNLDGNLTPLFTLSQRACLLKSQANSYSSCKLWKDHIDDRTKLKKFATVQTLFNVNESIIDIKPEWFSKMKYLSVLHLGSWRSETGDHIEVEDQKFMEDLKIMKQLKLFSLQGVSTIMKLPDSVCKLDILIILDLRECHNLEELPADIGCLKNLTHLDITNCHLLTKLPKGISLLSKLEVLNGFVIYNQAGGREDQKAFILNRWWKKTKGFVVHDVFRCEKKEVCTLRDLLKLANLRELSLVVNRDQFPDREEVEVFSEMEELCSLKISWVNNFENVGGDQGDSNARNESSTHKCGRCFPADAISQSSQKEMKKLQKLELWCFPCETAPDWLVPNVLKDLKKLYIKGGSLKSMNEVKEGNKWEVEMLRLKYLCNLEIKWGDLIKMFPEMTYLEKYECKKLGLFPCDHEGVWKKKGKLVR